MQYGLIETWRNLRFLVEQYGLTREHPQVSRAAEKIFSFQTQAGDLRGMLANQYATYYTGAMLATLIQAGYQDDPRTERGIQWLLGMRQADNGWTIAMLTHKLSREEQYRLSSQYAPPLEPDRSKPFSHNWTGMVLRAFGVHPVYRNSDAAKTGARLLMSRFFQEDVYTSYQDAGYWIRFEFPFWWNNLVAALDTVSRIGFGVEQEPVRQALDWLCDHQEADGLWKVTYAKAQEKESARARRMRPWIGLAICRVFRRVSAGYG